MKRSFNNNISVYDPDDYMNMAEIEFLDTGSHFFEKIEFKVNLSINQIFTKIKEYFPEDSRYNFFNSAFYITDGSSKFVRVFHDTWSRDSFDFDEDDVEAMSGKYIINFYHIDRKELDRIKKELSSYLEGHKTYSIVWSFSTSSGEMRKKEIFLPDQPPLIKEFYPWIQEDTVQEYWQNYLTSKDTILLLTGIPGTGKTTFIRNMISENKLNADITYDERLISSDEYFLRFINDKDKDILIIEDADTLLYDREETSNSLLSKILNISDGLVKNVSKKIVFSTNITDIEKIDPALIRPGRCYDVLDFRKLTHYEAQEVVDAKKIEKELENRDYTLAELFSSNNRSQKTKSRRVGF